MPKARGLRAYISGKSQEQTLTSSLLVQKFQENNVKLSSEPKLEVELEPEPEPEQYYNTKAPPDVPPKSQCSDVVPPEEENLYDVAV